MRDTDLILARHNGLGMRAPVLNRITGTFVNKKQERDFQSVIWPERRRVGIIVMSVLLTFTTLLSAPLAFQQGNGSPAALVSGLLGIAGLVAFAVALALLLMNRTGYLLDAALFAPCVTLSAYLAQSYLSGMTPWELVPVVLMSSLFIYGTFIPHRPPFALATHALFLGVYIGCGIHGDAIADPRTLVMFIMVWLASIIVVRNGASSRRKGVFQQQQYEELAERLDGNLHDLEFKNRAMERAAEENAALADDLALSRMAAEENASVLEVVLDNMSQGVMAYGPDEKIVKGNHQFAEFMGVPEELTRAGTPVKEIFERSFEAGVIPEERQMETALDTVRRYAENKSREPVVYERKNAFGGHYEIRLMPLPGGGAVSTITDITERKRADEIIRQQARHDPLTNLSNRLDYADRLDDALARCRRTGGYVALAYLDLDLFKPVNDTYGHSVGDAVLCELASILRAHVREVDTVARLGGDEFAIIFDGIKSVEDVSHPVNRILRAVAEPISIGDVEVRIGVSVGVAFFPADAHTAEDLAKAADRQLYEAKKCGRGCCKMSQLGEEPGTCRLLGDNSGIVVN